MTELKLQTLIDLRACQSQVDLFRTKFGESVDIAPELCESVASELDFEWAAENLLKATAYAEYERVRNAAYAEYERVTDPALAEYERVTASEFARQYIAQGGGGMNIQRYDLEPGSESMQRFPDGDYILYTDHLEAVKQARADALRWVLEQLDSHSGLSPGCIGHEISIRRRAVYAERLRLRAIIEKELSK